MLPNREGRFKATILEHGVSETGPNHLATFICRFQLLQELGNGQWMPVDEDLDITGYFYLEKRDGSLNTVTIESLKAAFGWDGRDPLWLQDTDFRAAGLVVQVKLAYEHYQGRARLKVQYVDAENSSGGGVPRADEGVRRSLASRLGAKLRASAGGTPAPAPRAAPQPAPKSAAPSPANRPGDVDAAWAAFVALFEAGTSAKVIESEWFRILGEMFPGRDAASLGAAEWARFDAESPKQIVPF